MRHRALLVVLLLLTSVAGTTSIAGASADADPTSTAGTAPGPGPASVAAQGDDCSFPYSATDVTGTEVTVQERPDRVTTLNPSAAQTMWEIGGEAQVVGVSKFAQYLDGAESRTNISAGFGADVEKVVGTEPDLVLAPNTTSPQTVQKLRQANLTVFHFEKARTIADVREKTTTIGRLTGNCDGAEETNAWMDANVEAAENATADVEDARALYPLGGGFVAGGETFISAMIEASGGSNVAAEQGITGYKDVSDETIVQLAPAVLVVTDTTKGIQTRQPYADTPAGQNNATVHVDTNYLNQPAPRSVVYSVRNLTTGFHPDVDAEFVARSEVSVQAGGSGDDGDGATATPTESPGTDSGGQPGFGVTAALVAAAIAALGLRRS